MAKGMNGQIQVVVVGSVALDTIRTRNDCRKDLLGGSVSYACTAASLFARAGAVGVVGTDFPWKYVRLYKRLGMDLAGLQKLSGRTFRWSGVYEDDMINRRTLRTELNVFESFSPVLPASYRNAPFVLLGNISPDLQLNVLGQITRPRFVVADTMDLWIRIARQRLDELIGRVDMLMLNDGEARQLTGAHNLKTCARDILRMGPRYVVIKKGEHGGMLFSRNGVFCIPAYPVDCVVDPTGAGDAFAGGFLGKLASIGRTDAGAVRLALLTGAVVASFGVEGFSLDVLSRTTRGDVRARLKELRRMTAV